MRKSDVVSGLFLALFGLVSLWLIIPAQISGHSDYGLAPDFFPRALMWVLVLLSVCLVVSRLRQAPATGDEGLLEDRPPLKLADWAFVTGAAVALVICYQLMNTLGFYWGGGFAILAAGVAMGNLRGHPIRLAVMTLVSPFVIAYLFRHLFYVFLPI